MSNLSEDNNYLELLEQEVKIIFLSIYFGTIINLVIFYYSALLFLSRARNSLHKIARE